LAGRHKAARLWRSFFWGEAGAEGTREQEDETDIVGEVLRIIGRVGGFALLILIANVGTRAITAQGSGTASQSQRIDCSKSGIICDPADNPVAEVRTERSWEYGPFVNWGMGLGN